MIHYDAERHLLFVGSSVKDFHEDIAGAVSGGTAVRIQDESIIRVFGRINRLRFIQAGVKKGGGRRHRYSMVTGQDVGETMKLVAGNSAIPSNFFGLAFEGGRPCSAGCSMKGKVWDYRQSNVRDFVEWCGLVGAKIQDATISTQDILGFAMAGAPRDDIPLPRILYIMWSDSLLTEVETRVSINVAGALAAPFYNCDIEFVDVSADRRSMRFDVISGASTSRFRMNLTGPPAHDHTFVQESGAAVEIAIGSRIQPLAQYFQDEPPVLLFADGSEMDGALYYPMRQVFDVSYPDDLLVVKDWTGIDIRLESIWNGGVERTGTVQTKALEVCIADVFDLIFNDDDPGEAADLVCMKIDATGILVRLVHCKFAHGANVGARLADVEVLASQATRSVRWNWKFGELCDHLVRRESVLRGKTTRYLQGDRALVRHFKVQGAWRNVRYEVICAQPGLSKSLVSDEQRTILGAANRYLIQTSEVSLNAWCSA